MKELRAVRPEPPWLPAREAGFRLKQIRASYSEGDQAGTIAAARLFLNGDNERRGRCWNWPRSFLWRETRTWP